MNEYGHTKDRGAFYEYGASGKCVKRKVEAKSPQSFAGSGYSHLRNLSGKVDRVDYLGGATFLTNENASGKEWGVTLGNFININNKGKITGDFTEYVISHPLYMHEYGHTIDSRIFGLSYLFVIGIPSLISADRDKKISGQYYTTHDIYWTETRANRHAKKYFQNHYNVNWNFPDYPLNK